MYDRYIDRRTEDGIETSRGQKTGPGGGLEKGRAENMDLGQGRVYGERQGQGARA